MKYELSVVYTHFLKSHYRNYGESHSMFLDCAAANEGVFSPTTNLQHACLLDYYLFVVWWAHGVWIPLIERPTAEQNLASFRKHYFYETGPCDQSITVDAAVYVRYALLFADYLLGAFADWPEGGTGCRLSFLIILINTITSENENHLERLPDKKKILDLYTRWSSMSADISPVPLDSASAQAPFFDFFSNIFCEHCTLLQALFGPQNLRLKRRKVSFR